ncbi:MAG: isoleucine--tRNA ligase [DPANN group archaeon]|nr:isoleucine--tRNA ligase [DPANN group archaeon]
MPSVYEPLKEEAKVAAFWESHRILQKLREMTKGGKPFYFLDGPPYTSGRIHLGTAWNKSLKDAILRYKRMQGFNVWDRAGYDMHGLPTENATQKKLGLKTKEDIQKFGIPRFIGECRKLCVSNMEIMNKEFSRLGVWMDFANAYQSITKEFMEGEWWLIKKAHEKGRLYEGLRTMTWCTNTESALAKHELEYRTLRDESIFIKMKLKGTKNEYFIIWTTTPWTIPLNLAIMVNPDLDYVRAQVGDEIWYVAAALANVFISGVAEKTYKVLETRKGKDLEGREYVHPLQQLLHQEYDRIRKGHPKTHTVVLSSEYVDTTAGTGLVHCAPGCGPEDYEIGYRNDLPAWNPVDERGVFPESMGPFAGLVARKDDRKFIEKLKEVGALVATSMVEHEYPHDWRYHQPVIFRTTKQWFFRIEDLKEKMIKDNEQISWVPQTAFNAFDSWLKNLRDNSISKQRYWGTPLPIWRNVEEEGDYLVIGSAEELETLSGKKVDDLHISTVDSIVIRKGGKTYRRIPDVLDVWVDAGTVSWNCLDYPQKDELFSTLFPADFILEGKDQIRGWFNLLMIASQIAFGKPPYTHVYMHGFVQDASGKKMSKSLGNIITPDEVVDKDGADLLRYYLIGAANPGLDLNYNKDDLRTKMKHLQILWNLHHYLIDYATHLGIDPQVLGGIEDSYDLEEQYMVSRIHSTIKKATERFDAYRINELPQVVGELFLELSRTYIQLTRDKVTKDEKHKAMFIRVIYETMMVTLRLFAPIAPFITETIYQDFRKTFHLKAESVHHLGWPTHQEGRIDETLESQVEQSKAIIQAILFARERAQLGVRWPLQRAIIVIRDKEVEEAAKRLDRIIRRQTNLREIAVVSRFDEVKMTVKANAGPIGKAFKDKAPSIITKLAQESAESVKEHFDHEGKFVIRLGLGEEEVTILPEQVTFGYVVPEKYVQVPFRNGHLYLDIMQTEELEAEGFAREVTRRVQEMRKKAGLKKADRIKLVISSDETHVNMLRQHMHSIEEKVGATLSLLTERTATQHQEEVKIKGVIFSLGFDV